MTDVIMNLLSLCKNSMNTPITPLKTIIGSPILVSSTAKSNLKAADSLNILHLVNT